MISGGLIRVLIADDSAYMRKVMREMIESSPLIQVVDTAWNGSSALEKTASLQPDVVIIDLYMPEMDGLDYIRKQMETRPIPIIVCSSATLDESMALAAMEAGAVEFVQKPTALALDSVYNIQQQLINAVIAAASVPFSRLPVPVAVPEEIPEVDLFRWPARRTSMRVDAVLIGISTGGPQALRDLLPRLPEDFPVPVAIVLHMPPGYTQALAFRLNEISQVEVLESAEGLEMRPGRVILARAGVHTRLQLSDKGVVTSLSEEPRDNLYIPAVDELFQSGAQAYQGRVLGVVMTGMGNDGTAGAAWLKAQGGIIFAESEESSVIFGMPRSVIEAGLADQVVSLKELPQAIMEAIL